MVSIYHVPRTSIIGGAGYEQKPPYVHRYSSGYQDEWVVARWPFLDGQVAIFAVTCKLLSCCMYLELGGRGRWVFARDRDLRIYCRRASQNWAKFHDFGSCELISAGLW
jgi:hypothetical protein